MANRTTLSFDHEADHCAVPAADIIDALSGPAMDALCVAGRDIESMTNRQVESLLTSLEEDDNPDVVAAAQDALGRLCPGDGYRCHCTSNALDTFRRQCWAELNKNGRQVGFFAVMADPDRSQAPGRNTVSSKLFAAGEKWDRFTRLERAGTARTTRLVIDHGTGDVTITYNGADGEQVHELRAVPKARQWAALSWQSHAEEHDQPDPVDMVLAIPADQFTLLSALNNSSVSVKSSVPAHAAGWHGHALVWEVMLAAGLTTMPPAQQRLMATVAAGFTGTLPELEQAVATALVAAQTTPTP